MSGSGQLALDLGQRRPAMTGADFLVAPSNQEAVAWLDRWPGWPTFALVVVGPPGCGKTHLASVWQARANAPLVAAAELEVDTLPGLLAAGKDMAIDCADAVAGQSRREQALLHLFNLVREAEGHLLLTARATPARWGLGLADLRSRLVALPVVAVGPPDDGLLGALLVKLFADRQLRVGADVVAFLTTHMERSFEAARLVVAALDAAALAEGRSITVPLARAVLVREAGARHSEE